MSNQIEIQKLRGWLSCAGFRVTSIASRNKLRSSSLFGSISEAKMTRKSMKFRISEPSALRSHFGVLQNVPKSIKIRFQTPLFFRHRFCTEFSWFSVPIWGPKTFQISIKFVYLRALEATMLLECFWHRFWNHFDAPKRRNLWILARKRFQIWIFSLEFRCEIQTPGLFQTSSGLIFWETCADD